MLNENEQKKKKIDTFILHFIEEYEEEEAVTRNNAN